MQLSQGNNLVLLLVMILDLTLDWGNVELRFINRFFYVYFFWKKDAIKPF